MGDKLRIGGVTVRCSGGFVETLESKRPPPRKGRRIRVKKKVEVKYSETDGEADSERDLEDYFENLLAGQDTEDEADTFQALTRFSGTDLEAGSEIDALRSPGFPESDSSSLADSEDNTSCSDDLPSISDIADDFVESLQLHSCYPVQTRGQQTPGLFPGSAPLPSTSSKGKAIRHGRKEKANMGENRKLKRQKVQARRAARAAAKGLDLEVVKQQLQELVAREGDMEAFPPMSSTGRMYVRKMAALFGMKSSEQGQGKRAFVLVRSTERTVFPEGPANEKLNALIQQYNKAHAMLGPSEQKSRSKMPPGGRKRQTLKGGRRKPVEHASTPSAFQQPVGFIASGCLDSSEPQLVMMESVAARREAVLGASDSKDIAMADTAAEEDMRVYDPLYHMGLGSCVPPAADGVPVAEPEPLLAGSLLDVFEDRPSNALAAGPQPMEPDDFGGGEGSEAEGPEERCRPSILRTKAQCKAALKKLQKEARRADRRGSDFLPLDPSPAPFVSTSLGYGEFERHTRGIGSKLMADMGFRGQGAGLGRLQEGRAEPISSFMRPKKLGLGA